jgi:hypothetical protein
MLKRIALLATLVFVLVGAIPALALAGRADVYPASSTGEWYAEYFTNPYLSGNPALVRWESAVHFDWEYDSPMAGVIPPDYFSARWSRTVHLTEGAYRFKTKVDDGVRLWVNGHLLIDSWREQSVRTYTADIYLPGGDIPIKMAYYEKRGVAVASLSWQLIGGAPQPTPGVVVIDNGDAGFLRGGSEANWHTSNQGYNGDLRWTYNNQRNRWNYNWARWYPKLAAGTYEVSVFIPSAYKTTHHARYWVYHNDNYSLSIIDQTRYHNTWVSLGTYWFDGSGDEYVSLTDVTFEDNASRLIVFDAVKWELISAPIDGEPIAPKSCSIPIGSAFADRLNARPDILSALGCPAAAPQTTWAAEQAFERGRMVWQQDTHQVYIMYHNGHRYELGLDPYIEGEPADGCPELGGAPAGLHKPVRGFNRQWCNASVRNQLGWGTENEHGFDAVWQRFAYGHVMLSREGHIYAFLYDSKTWKYVE